MWWFPRIQGDPPPLQLIPQRDRESDLLQRSIVQSLQHMLFNPGDSWTVWKLVLTLDTIFTKNITKLQVGYILQHGSGVIYTVYIHIKNIHGLRTCIFLHIYNRYMISNPAILDLFSSKFGVVLLPATTCKGLVVIANKDGSLLSNFLMFFLFDTANFT